jgi:hypothetical protein
MTKEEQDSIDWQFVADVLFHGDLKKMLFNMHKAFFKAAKGKDKATIALYHRLDKHIQEVQTTIKLKENQCNN